MTVRRENARWGLMRSAPPRYGGVSTFRLMAGCRDRFVRNGWSILSYACPAVTGAPVDGARPRRLDRFT
jgi:hypothetical protein